MIEGACLCGGLRWEINAMPESATACNCTACRRYGTLWAYGHEGEDIRVFGENRAYSRDRGGLGFHFCTTCGCVGYWRSLEPGPDGRRRIAVNLRLSEPEPIADLPIDHFEGLESFEDLPRDQRCIRDMWF